MATNPKPSISSITGRGSKPPLKCFGALWSNGICCKYSTVPNQGTISNEAVLQSQIERSERAENLLNSWDRQGYSYFQQREFLSYAEKFNPCKQRYYSLVEDGEVCAGCIVYTLKLDLFTFADIHSPVKMNILGVPIGTATAGYFGEPVYRQKLLHYVAQNESGMLVTLNADPSDALDVGVRCRMVPTICFDNRYSSWPDYIAALRYPHRRRILHITQSAEHFSRIVSDCSLFTDDHYHLYRQVHDRAPAKLETLTREFFHNLPPRFQLSSYYRDGRLISWTITVHDGTMFMYFFGGMDYANLKETGSYFIGLCNIVKDCVEGGHPLLDLGQTAEEPKLRFGGRQVSKDMYLTHNNAVVRQFFRWFQGLLEYRDKVPSFHVFRNCGEIK